MRKLIIFSACILTLGIFGFAISGNDKSVLETDNDRMHRAFIEDQLIALMKQCEDRMKDDYAFMDLGMVNGKINKEQYDSLMQFRIRMYNYRSLLDDVRARMVAKAEGLSLNAADTLSNLLIKNLDFKCTLNKDTFLMLQGQSEEILNWVNAVPFCDQKSAGKLEMTSVWDYGHGGEKVEWSDAALSGVTLDQFLLTLYILRLRSQEAEEIAFDQMRNGLSHFK